MRLAGGDRLSERELPLRYGMNPHQTPARAAVASGTFPLTVLNGTPGYINLLDALNAWQLVRELDAAMGQPAAASFKHTAPAGAALGLPLSGELARVYRASDQDRSPLAAAYARARGADRLASFGDLAALSAPVDLATARLLAREVSDGVIAPGYDEEALTILRRKKNGRYLVMAIDPLWQPTPLERRDLFGITLEQPRNDAPVTLGQIVTQRQDLSTDARRDLLLAAITLKYTPSNSICLALGGQAIGVGAGQQSRIFCTRLACEKAEQWWLRQHPHTLALRYQSDLSRPERDNAVEGWLRGERVTGLIDPPAILAEDERRSWIGQLRNLSLASDGLIPFRDNLDRAAQTGVGYVWQPGGSNREGEVIAAANEHNMVMCHASLRLFHH